MIANKEIMENVKQSRGPQTMDHILDVDDSRPTSVNSKREIVTLGNTSGDIKVLNTTTFELNGACFVHFQMI